MQRACHAGIDTFSLRDQRVGGGARTAAPSDATEPSNATAGAANATLAGLADTELAHTPAQRARIETEQRGGALFAFDAPAALREHAADMSAFDVFERCARRRRGNGSVAGIELERQVLRLERPVV